MTMKQERLFLLLVWISIISLLLSSIKAEDPDVNDLNDENEYYNNLEQDYYNMWPPPSSYYSKSDCFLKVGACTSAKLHQDDNNTNETPALPSVGVTIFCPNNIDSQPPQTYVLPISKYLELAVEYHAELGNEFCDLCSRYCGLEQEYTLPPSISMLQQQRSSYSIRSSPSRLPNDDDDDPDLVYTFPTCMEACDRHGVSLLGSPPADNYLQETAYEFLTCTAVRPPLIESLNGVDKEYYGFPMCLDGSIELVFSPSSDCDPTPSIGNINSLLWADDLDRNQYSTRMWDTITSFDQPLSCGRSLQSDNEEGGGSKSWCDSIRMAGTECETTTISEEQLPGTESMDDFLCRVNLRNPPRNVVPDLPFVQNVEGIEEGLDEEEELEVEPEDPQDSGGFANELETLQIYGMWPPPPSYYTSSDCFLQLGACTPWHNVGASDETLPLIAVTLYCPHEVEPQVYVLTIDDYMQLAVDHHKGLEDEFCSSCQTFCLDNNDIPIGQAYEFARGGRRTLRYDQFNNDPDFYYNCETCAQACQQRNLTTLQETALVFGSCSALQGDQEYFGGPVCMGGDVDIGIFPRLDTDPSDKDNMCNHAVKVAGEDSILPSVRIDSNAYSHVMWRTLLATDRPLSCGRRGGQDVGGQENELGKISNWCTEIRNAATTCESLSDSQINSTEETMAEFLCRIHQSYPPANVVPPAPTVPHTGSRFDNDDHSFYDLTGQSLQFLRCEQRENTDSISPRSSISQSKQVQNLLEPRVVIQLCWKGDIETMNYCDRSENYCNDYVLGVSAYLKIVARHQQDTMNRACTDCRKTCIRPGSAEPGKQRENGNDEMIEGELKDELWLVVQDRYYQQQQLQHQSPEFMDMICDACLQDAGGGESCWNNDNSNMNKYSNSTSYVDCDTCSDECDKIENMEENGYIDATSFNSCQMLYDSDQETLYAGPVCKPRNLSSSSTPVKMGVFLDEQCRQLDPTKRVDDYIMDSQGFMMRLSYFMLKHITDSRHSMACSVEPATYVPQTGLKRSDRASSSNQLCQELLQAATLLEEEEEGAAPIILDEIVDVDGIESSSNSRAQNGLAVVAALLLTSFGNNRI